MRYLPLALILVCLVGCGKKETTTITTPDGSVTVSEDGSKVTTTNDKGETATVETNPDGMTVTSPEGTVRTGTEVVSEKDLGLPFYPGSKEQVNASMLFESTGNFSCVPSRTTADSPEKVIEFYAGKLKDEKKSSATAGGTTTAGLTGKRDDGADVVIAATKEGSGETTIAISVTKKS